MPALKDNQSSNCKQAYKALTTKSLEILIKGLIRAIPGNENITLTLTLEARSGVKIARNEVNTKIVKCIEIRFTVCDRGLDFVNQLCMGRTSVFMSVFN